MDRISGTEPVIDVDDGDAWSAGVEHPKKGGDSLEVGSISNGCGDGDEGGADESAQNAGKGGFHSGDDNQGMVVAKYIEVLQGPVEACDTDVIKSGGTMPKEFQGDVGFFRNRMIGGSCGTYGDMKGGVGRRRSSGRSEGEGSGGGVILRLGKKAAELSGFHGVDPSCEDGLACRAEAANDG